MVMVECLLYESFSPRQAVLLIQSKSQLMRRAVSTRPSKSSPRAFGVLADDGVPGAAPATGLNGSSSGGPVAILPSSGHSSFCTAANDSTAVPRSHQTRQQSRAVTEHIQMQLQLCHHGMQISLSVSLCVNFAQRTPRFRPAHYGPTAGVKELWTTGTLARSISMLFAA